MVNNGYIIIGITIYLVGGLEHDWIMTFHMLGIMIPTDEFIFFRGVQTTNQEMVVNNGDTIWI